jgi:hypothetical protein
MGKAPKHNKGLPKALAAEEDADVAAQLAEQDLRSFVEDMHGEGSADIEQSGMPTREWLQEQFKTKSAIIRYLINQKYEVNAIAKHLGLRYQHVRNVATNDLKRGPNEDWRKPLLEGLSIPDSKRFKPDDV